MTISAFRTTHGAPEVSAKKSTGAPCTHQFLDTLTVQTNKIKPATRPTSRRQPQRRFKTPWSSSPETLNIPVAGDAADGYINNHLNNVHATHVLLYNIGQVAERPTLGTTPKAQTWTDRLLPEPCPAPIRAAVERYLRLRLEAKFDRPQTVRLARESLRRFINWLSAEHPDVDKLSRVDRSTAEEYLKWLPTYLSKYTGKPLAVTTLKHEINALAAFCRDTAVWGWTDVPGEPLVTLRDTPRRPEAIPRARSRIGSGRGGHQRTRGSQQKATWH